MTYGVKHGFKAPGEFRMGDILGLGLAGAAGIIAALVTDFQQQGESSALFTINRWTVELGSLLGFTDIPLWMVVIGLTTIGAGSVFYFQPITRQGAFAQGFGLLAVFMTAVPPDLAGGIEAITGGLPGLQPAAETHEASLGAGIINASFSTQNARVYEVQNRTEASKYEVNLRIVFTNGIPNNIESMIRRGTIRGRLHNEDTGETWNIFRSAGGTIRQQGDTLLIHAGVPARSQSARLWVRIECVGYAIEEQSAMASLDDSLEWRVEMKPSSMPLFVQRLGKSYWF
jgi:predicted outer membrane lipoprotein